MSAMVLKPTVVQGVTSWSSACSSEPSPRMRVQAQGLAAATTAEPRRPAPARKSSVSASGSVTAACHTSNRNPSCTH